jgi:hypothetical protein
LLQDRGHPEDDRPKKVTRNFGIERPDYPSEACLLVLLKGIAWCPLQHGRLLSPAFGGYNGMKLKGASWFPANVGTGGRYRRRVPKK